MNSTRPQNFAELCVFLVFYPWVRRHHPREPAPELWEFAHVDQAGHLWFRSKAGRCIHVPAGGPCGPGGHVPRLTFSEEGFMVELFGLEVYFTYETAPASR